MKESICQFVCKTIDLNKLKISTRKYKSIQVINTDTF